MFSRFRRWWYLGLALCLAAGPARAQQDMDDLVGEPSEQIVGGIAFVSGGIGSDERAALAALAKKYNLLLMFRMRGSTEALTDVDVTIAHQKGGVLLATRSEGPMFLARLPKGRYIVQATYDDRTLKRTIIIGARGKSSARRIILRWNPSTD